MQICQLSKSEAEKMQHPGFVPDCHSHPHLSKRDAKQAEADGRVRFVSPRAVVPVGPPPGSEYWYDRSVGRNDRYLGAARSGVVRTLQLLSFMPRARHKVSSRDDRHDSFV